MIPTESTLGNAPTPTREHAASPDAESESPRVPLNPQATVSEAQTTFASFVFSGGISEPATPEPSPEGSAQQKNTNQPTLTEPTLRQDDATDSNAQALQAGAVDGGDPQTGGSDGAGDLARTERGASDGPDLTILAAGRAAGPARVVIPDEKGFASFDTVPRSLPIEKAGEAAPPSSPPSLSQTHDTSSPLAPALQTTVRQDASPTPKQLARDMTPPGDPPGVPQPQSKPETIVTTPAPVTGAPSGFDLNAIDHFEFMPRTSADITPPKADPVRAQIAPSAEARAVTAQLAVAIVKSDNGKIDIRLDPPELGRLSVTLTSENDTISAVIAADKADTQDLLRRHADLLQRAMREAGYSEVTLEFSNSADDGQRGTDNADDGDHGRTSNRQSHEPIAYALKTASSGLDIRI